MKKDWKRSYVCLGISEDQKYRIADISYPVASVEFEDMGIKELEDFIKNFNVVNVPSIDKISIIERTYGNELDATGSGAELPMIAVARDSKNNKIIVCEFDGKIHSICFKDCDQLIRNRKLVNLKFKDLKKSNRKQSVDIDLPEISALSMPRELDVSKANMVAKKLSLLGTKTEVKNDIVLTKAKSSNGLIRIPGIPIIDSGAIKETNVNAVEFREGIEVIKRNAVSILFDKEADMNIRLPDSLIRIENGGIVAEADSLYIGEHLEEMRPEDISVADTITVSDKNKHYSAYDGALYNKDKTQLMYVPYMKRNIKVHPSCKEITSGSFTGPLDSIDFTGVKIDVIKRNQFECLCLNNGIKIAAHEVKQNAFYNACLEFIEFTNSDKKIVDAGAFNGADTRKIKIQNYQIVKDIGTARKPVIVERNRFDDITFLGMKIFDTGKRNEFIKNHLMPAISRFYYFNDDIKTLHPEYLLICNKVLNMAALEFNKKTGLNLFFELSMGECCAMKFDEGLYYDNENKKLKNDIDKKLEKQQGISYKKDQKEYCKAFEQMYNQEITDRCFFELELRFTKEQQDEIFKQYVEIKSKVISEYVDSGEYDADINYLESAKYE